MTFLGITSKYYTLSCPQKKKILIATALVSLYGNNFGRKLNKHPHQLSYYLSILEEIINKMKFRLGNLM